jgi:hypothetical protein
MRYELFLKFFPSDYHFLDQASQSKKVLNLIWHKHGSKVGPLMMVRAVNNWLLIRPGATQRRRKFPSLNFFSPLRHLSLAWSLFFIFLSEAKIRRKKKSGPTLFFNVDVLLTSRFALPSDKANMRSGSQEVICMVEAVFIRVLRF